MEEIIFSLKHYWRFVDSEVFELKAPDFSDVPFRLNFMLFSEKNHVKALKNQWVLPRP